MMNDRRWRRRVKRGGGEERWRGREVEGKRGGGEEGVGSRET